jgi:DNA-binding ferritin-like protein
MDPIGDFILSILHTVTNTHILHWQSKSFSEHTALGEFYSELSELVDNLVESMQGKYATILQYPATYHAPSASGLEELQAFGQYFAMGRQQLPQDSEIQNICDEIANLIDQTTYKLTFLK